jgi:hypothetical protein
MIIVIAARNVTASDLSLPIGSWLRTSDGRRLEGSWNKNMLKKDGCDGCMVAMSSSHCTMDNLRGNLVQVKTNAVRFLRPSLVCGATSLALMEHCTTTDPKIIGFCLQCYCLHSQSVRVRLRVRSYFPQVSLLSFPFHLLDPRRSSA